MSYYTTPLADAEFVLRDNRGKKLLKVKGKTKSSPFTGYPSYQAIIANGVTEIIEHRKMEPVFYINDDPVVRERVLGETTY